MFAEESAPVTFSLSGAHSAGWEPAIDNVCKLNKYLGSGTYISLLKDGGQYALEIENTRTQLDVWKEYPVIFAADGAQKTLQIRPYKFEAFIVPLGSEAALNATQYDIGIDGRHYNFNEPDMKSVAARITGCNGGSAQTADLDRIAPAAEGAPAQAAAPAKAIKAEAAAPRILSAPVAETTAAPPPVQPATPASLPVVTKAESMPAPLSAPAATKSKPEPAPVVKAKSPSVAAANPPEPVSEPVIDQEQAADEKEIAEALKAQASQAMKPAPAPFVPDSRIVAEAPADQGALCTSSDQYKNLVRKINLLEAEKEKLRSSLASVDMSPALQKVTQCASESYQIKALTTELTMLKKENDELRAHAAAVQNLDNLNDALTELDKAVAHETK